MTQQIESSIMDHHPFEILWLQKKRVREPAELIYYAVPPPTPPAKSQNEANTNICKTTFLFKLSEDSQSTTESTTRNEAQHEIIEPT